MDDSQYRRGLDDFDAAITSLDEDLTQHNLQIEIKAIGGYALLKHSIRQGDDALTVDIDSVTREYRRPVLEAIKRVGEKQGLSPTWLNTDNVFDDPEIVEQMLQAEWLPQQTEHQSISLALADLPTLTRSKIMAAADTELSGREHDIADLFALAKAQGFKNVQQFRAAFPDPYDEFEPAYDALLDMYRQEYHQNFPELARAQQHRAGLADPSFEHEY